MKRSILILTAVAVVVALTIGCRRTGRGASGGGGGTGGGRPSAGKYAFHSPIQPLDAGVLSSVPSGKRDFRRDPPVAESVTAEALTGNDVRVQVRFAEANLPSVLMIQTEREPVALRDDGKNGDAAGGDRVFTAVTQVPPEFLRERQEAAARVSRTQGKALVFRDRKLVSIGDAARLGPAALANIFDFPTLLTGVDTARSLMIVDPSVVNDPTRAGNPCVAGSNAMGPWSFGFLMNEMANQTATGISGSQFVEAWLNQWAVSQPINGPSVPARPNVNSLIIAPWRTASGGGSAPLDLAKAPVHLLAIVNRMDLGDNPGYGGSASAGELRFVFGVLNGCSPTPFAIILEYGIPPKSCLATRNLAQAWKNLSTLPINSNAYRTALQALTDPVVTRNAGGAKPNGSAINQVRTNEILLGAPWELREFRVEASSRLLRETTVKQTPINTFDNTPAVATYVNSRTAAILAHQDIVPLQFPPGTPFLAGNAPIPPSFWNGPGIADNNARNLFSLSTCNGCHAGETNTPFVHINPNTPIGTAAGLSGFLTGITVTDPGDGVTPRHYHDLLDRQNKLNAKASSPCFFITLFQQPLRMVH